MRRSLAVAVWIVALIGAAVWDAGNPGPLSYRWIPLAALAGVAATAVWAGTAEGRRRQERALWALAPAVLLIGVYALNPTHRLDPDYRALLPVASIRWLPGAASAPAARRAFGLALAAAAVFSLSRALRVRDARWVFRGLTVLGGAVGMLALHQRLAHRPFPVFEFTGAFVSRNHFAAFANLLIPLALAAGRRAQLEAARAASLSNPAPLFYLAAALLGTAVVLAGARAGLLLLIGSLAAWTLADFRLRRVYGHWHGPRWNLGVLPLTLGGALILAAAAALGRGLPRRLAFASEEWLFRWTVLRDTLAIWRDNPWWGVGPGAFSIVFPFYQSEELLGRAFLHAHCEPAQWLAELGVLGLGWVLACVVIAAALARRDCGTSAEEPPTAREIEAPACAIALATAALHGLVDFPFRAPAIALLAAFCAGRLFAPRSREHRQNGSEGVARGAA